MVLVGGVSVVEGLYELSSGLSRSLDVFTGVEHLLRHLTEAPLLGSTWPARPAIKKAYLIR